MEESKKKEKDNQPGDQERLIQTIKNIDNQVLISNCLNLWPWKLPINQNTLKKESVTQWRIIHLQAKQENGCYIDINIIPVALLQEAICLHMCIPGKKPIWVFTIDAAEAQNQEQGSE